MKVVTGNLSHGMWFTVKEPWFVEMVERAGAFTEARPVKAFDTAGQEILINPRLIANCRVIEP